MMKRHRVGSSMLLILAGVLMVGLMLFLYSTVAECFLILVVGGGLLILWGSISLMLAVSSTLWTKAKNATAPRADPILTFLDSVGIRQFAFEPYEESKTQMINFISKKMVISRREVRQRIDKLEQQGKLVYLARGEWVLNVSGQPLDQYRPPLLGGDWEHAGSTEWPSGE